MRERDRDRPRGGRGPGDGGRGPGDRPNRGPGDRPNRGPGDRPDRPFKRGFDRPADGPRRFERKPGRPFGRPGDRPFEQRGDRPLPRRQFDEQPDRPTDEGDRPTRPFDRPTRPFDRPPRSFDRPQRSFDRPFRPGPGPHRPPYRPAAPRVAGPATAERTDLLGEGEELVAGRRPVSEAFAARRSAKRLLVVPDRRAALESIVLHATTLRLPIVEVEGGTLTSLTGFDGHQGVALVVGQRSSASVQDMLARAARRDEPAFLLVLDSLEDPQNLGTLLRSAEACGVHGVIYPSRHAAPLTAAAIKASAGATEHLLLASVDNLPGTLADLRSAGLRLVGADEGAPLRYAEADLRGPLALVVGSEERGISGALRRRLDMTVRIPMRGRVASLNAAVAGSVLLFAAADQRGAAETGDRSEEPFEQVADEVVADAPGEAAGAPIEPTATAPSPDDPESAPATAAEDHAEGHAEDPSDQPSGDELLPGEPAAD